MTNMLLGLLQIVRIPDGQFGELISQIFLICAASKHDVYCLILRRGVRSDVQMSSKVLSE